MLGDVLHGASLFFILCPKENKEGLFYTELLVGLLQVKTALALGLEKGM